MKKIIVLAFVVIISVMSVTVFASEGEERVYLTQVLNQLDAAKHLIVSASKEQSKASRIQFHYTAYRDCNGKLHRGLLDDINAIQLGIKEKLNRVSIEPRLFQPIKGDYIDHTVRSKATW